MERKEFLQLGCCAALVCMSSGVSGAAPPVCDDRLKFVQDFLSDLMETIDSELDEGTKQKLLAGCGRACFKRFKFKQDIAQKGKGNVDNLIEALRQNFEVWREKNTVHIRYGAVNKNGCYCPAANYRPGNSKDIHCYCTQAMHQAIWEAALGRPVKIDILQTVRRGDPTCHFVAYPGT